MVIVGELAADHFEDLPGASDLKLQFVRGLFNNEATLVRAGVSIGADRHRAGQPTSTICLSDPKAVLAVLALREMDRGCGGVLRLLSNRAHLRRAGADRVVVSGELDGYLLTAASLSPGLDSAVKDALTFGDGNAIWIQPIPAEFVGRTCQDLAGAWLASEATGCWSGWCGGSGGWTSAKCWPATRAPSTTSSCAASSRPARGAKAARRCISSTPARKYTIREDDMGIVILPSAGEVWHPSARTCPKPTAQRGAERVECVSCVALFRTTGAQVHDMARLLEPVRYAAGDVLTVEGEEAVDFYILVEGTVSVLKKLRLPQLEGIESDDRILTKIDGTTTPVLGETALVGGGVRLARCAASPTAACTASARRSPAELIAQDVRSARACTGACARCSTTASNRRTRT